MAQQQKGKHKKYGPKLPNPRISESKEHRGCGPIGLYQKFTEGHWPRWRRVPAAFAEKRAAQFRPVLLAVSKREVRVVEDEERQIERIRKGRVLAD